MRAEYWTEVPIAGELLVVWLTVLAVNRLPAALPWIDPGRTGASIEDDAIAAVYKTSNPSEPCVKSQ